MMAVPVLVAADRIDEARFGAERALVIARERGAMPGLTIGLCLKGYVAWAFGDLVAAEADLESGRRDLRFAGIAPTALLYTTMLVEIRTERDELDAAEALLQASACPRGNSRGCVVRDDGVLAWPSALRARRA